MSWIHPPSLRQVTAHSGRHSTYSRSVSRRRSTCCQGPSERTKSSLMHHHSVPAHINAVTTTTKVTGKSLSQVHPTARLYLPGGSMELTAFLAGQGHHLTQRVIRPTGVPAKWHLNPSNSLRRVHECDRRQSDRQTTLWRCV